MIARGFIVLILVFSVFNAYAGKSLWLTQIIDEQEGVAKHQSERCPIKRIRAFLARMD